MKLFFDFLPGVLFLGALYLFDIYVATMVIMAAMTLQVLGLLVLRKKVTGMQWFTLAVILAFGAATLVLHNPVFIKWKPTVIYWIFAAALLLGPVLFKRNFIQMLMKEQLTLPDHAWSKLNLGWAVFMAALGGLNLWVAYTFSEKTWGLFKVFGVVGLMVVFMVGQLMYFSKYMKSDEAETP